jgi:hypothetical protein
LSMCEDRLPFFEGIWSGISARVGESIVGPRSYNLSCGEHGDHCGGAFGSATGSSAMR